ncbi:hypothetical protein V1L54_26980 [Streptomyces sp. TRM 70361]|uniref:hypothetical protein n=1 Tax=Streptomyces sp. TRM 70361 TaxID=3116553 RepID=UPI002E7C4B57|nr:hypothetical protein [Streptomyces sp. TRM 70361]MEE1943009.1 hypothetical protein [Streptomyces sp. TRM 70361]
MRLARAQQADGKLALVLTCRTRTYQALQEQRVWAQDAARVEIRPITPGPARAFLTARVTDPGRWQPVFDALARDPGGPLADGLSTPWRLTPAAIVYEQRRENTGAYPRDPAELLDPGLDTAAAVGEHLLARLIPAATALHNQRRGTSYTPQQVCAWLTELAAYLNTNTATERSVGGRVLSGTDIVLHELWPLAGPHLPRGGTEAR